MEMLRAHAQCICLVCHSRAQENLTIFLKTTNIISSRQEYIQVSIYEVR